MDSTPFDRIIRVLVMDTSVVQALKKMRPDLRRASLDPVVSSGCIMPTGQVVLYATATHAITVWTSLKQLAEILSQAPNLALYVDAPLLQEAGTNALVC